MRLGALALIALLGGCQLLLGIDDPGGDDAPVDALEVDAPEGMCFEAGTARPIVPPLDQFQLSTTELMVDPVEADDATGQWIELRATVDLDLNGTVLTDTITALAFDDADCLRVPAGGYLLIAASADPGDNGGLPAVDAILPFELSSSGRLELHRPDGAEIHFVNYADAPVGTSLIIDDPNVCAAPVGTPTYNGTDVGTPRATNVGGC